MRLLAKWACHAFIRADCCHPTRSSPGQKIQCLDICRERGRRRTLPGTGEGAVAIRPRDRGRHRGDLDKGNCIRDRRANLNCPSDSRRPGVVTVDVSLRCLCAVCSAVRSSSGPFRNSVRRSRAARQLSRLVWSSKPSLKYASRRRCLRISDLDPAFRWTGAINRSPPLRYDASNPSSHTAANMRSP